MIESPTTQSIIRQAIAVILKQEEDLTKEQEQLNIDRQEFEQKIKQIQQLVKNTDVIRLNVGGQLITTTRETLTRVSKSILAIMFNGRWQHKLPMDQEGNIFLDFNPLLFRHLLDQLQTFEKNNPIIFHPPLIPTLVIPFNKMLQKLGFSPSLSAEDSVITLNVGGQTVTNRHKTLIRLSNINFDTSVSSFNSTTLTNNKLVFIDYDPKFFQHLISHLREESPKNRCSLIVSSHREHDTFKRILLDLGVHRAPICLSNTTANIKWNQNGITIAGGNGQGSKLNQLYYPQGLYIDDDQTVYIADYLNHRIMEWKSNATSGRVVAGGNGSMHQNNFLSYPTDVVVDKATDVLIICDYGNKRVVRWSRRNSTIREIIISNISCLGLAIDNDGYLYVSDYSKHEVIRWKLGTGSWTVVAGGNGRGNRLDQLNGPYCIFVDQDHSIYVSNYKNHRVMKWMKGAKEGIVVAGGQGQGNNLTQLSHPGGIVVDQFGAIYVADYRNHRIVRWTEGATQGSIVVGDNRSGGGADQLSSPWSLSFDQQGNLYVVDRENSRVQKFLIDSSSYT